jgi:hypothetical protein
MSRIKEFRVSLEKKLDSLEHQALALEAQLTQIKVQAMHMSERSKGRSMRAVKDSRSTPLGEKV